MLQIECTEKMKLNHFIHRRYLYYINKNAIHGRNLYTPWPQQFAILLTTILSEILKIFHLRLLLRRLLFHLRLRLLQIALLFEVKKKVIDFQ